MNTKALVDEYTEKRPSYEQFQRSVCDLLTRLLQAENIQYHQISGRSKEPDSLEKKIDTKQGKYSSLFEITDLSAARVITYLASDIDQVCEIIRSEFSIDEMNSADKRKKSIAEFGYASVHLVAGLNDARLSLKEYEIFKGMKLEIQVRSILQHAWAEIEHDLGYKGAHEVPEEFKRNFSRVAALLETADIEFDRLKAGLQTYIAQLPAKMQENDSEVEINKESLIAFIQNSEFLREVNQIIQAVTECEMRRDTSIEGIPERVRHFGIMSIHDLNNRLAENGDKFKRFVSEYCVPNKGRYVSLPEITSIYYFLHYLAAKTQSKNEIRAYSEAHYPPIDMSNDFDERILEIYKSLD